MNFRTQGRASRMAGRIMQQGSNMNSFSIRVKLAVLVPTIVVGFLLMTMSRGSAASNSVPSAPSPSPVFETGQVRPLAMSPDKTRLFAVNTPDDALEIFQITPRGLVWQARVPVGVQPVAVSARNNNEVWVVNYLSDSVSVVSLTGTPHVIQTLLVGDQPQDVVFAGAPERAFITTAHRGQQRSDPSIADVPGAGDPQLTTPGIGRADVWIFDPRHLGNTVGGRPVKIMTFFTDSPRALAVSPDRKTVYVAGFKTGNQTTTIPEESVCDGFKPHQPCTAPDGSASPGGNPGPATNFEGKQAPKVGLIVKFNNKTQRWEDELGRNWNSAVRFRLPDTDVFAVNAHTLTQTTAFAHVGTTLFNMVTNPASGKLYVSNTEAFNQFRFEGPGNFGGHTVQGHLAETRITVISGSSVLPRHLNKHIDYSKLAGKPGFDLTAKEHSLSTPLGMAVTHDGHTLYLAAFGSSKIGVFDTEALENDTFNPRAISSNYIPVSGGGPSGLALDETRGRLYVMTRFDNSVKVIDLASKQEIAKSVLPDPEPESVIAGRPMLYDATRFSGNGEASCASCHIFGDTDDLAWDLGNPDAQVIKNPTRILFVEVFSLGAKPALTTPLNGTGGPNELHPMKGPMTTQTLQGLKNSGAMHWRGDRGNGHFGIDPVDSRLSFDNFIVAFKDLLGSPELPPESEMHKFTDFQLQVLPPPNPVRHLDNSLTAAQQRGRDFYFGGRPSDGVTIKDKFDKKLNCNGCHALDPAQGFYGTGRESSVEPGTQMMKIPQLRTLYTKVGMFGHAKVKVFQDTDSGPMGNQVRGFGYLNDGSADTLFHFFNKIVFEPLPQQGFPVNNPDPTRRDVEQFVLAYDSDLAPIVGQQVTLTHASGPSVNRRIDLLIQRAQTEFISKSLGGKVKECQLEASLVLDGRMRNLRYDPMMKQFISDDATAHFPDGALRALAKARGRELTYTCKPPGSRHIP
jgi:DNA-binding beta-propeller fold protein YncE